MSFWKGVGIIIVGVLCLLIIIPLLPVVGIALLALLLAFIEPLAALF